MKATHAELPGGRAAGRTPAEASQAATSEGDKTFRAYAPEQLLLCRPRYAGLSDVFVTSDRRMRLILSDYVQADRAEILDVDACLALIRRSPDR